MNVNLKVEEAGNGTENISGYNLRNFCLLKGFSPVPEITLFNNFSASLSNGRANSVS